MLRTIKSLSGSSIWAADGRIGSVDEFLFDDERWAVRYLVVDTGKWLPGRRVLISPFSIHSIDWSTGTVALSTTRTVVKSSPDIDTDKPVSRQKEAEYLRHYGFPYYWGGVGLWGPVPYPAGLAAARAAWAQARMRDADYQSVDEGDAHLRSSKEVIGYHLQASDGELGHVEDFLVEDETWVIRYIVVDTSNWWFGNKVLIPPPWIRVISWHDRKVYVDVTRGVVKHAPRHDAVDRVTRRWERDYFVHFGRQPYWSDERPREQPPPQR